MARLRFAPWSGSPGVIETVDLDETPETRTLSLSAAAQPATFEGIAQDIEDVGSPASLTLAAQAQPAAFDATLDRVPTIGLTLGAAAQPATFDGTAFDLPGDYGAVFGAQLEGWHDASNVSGSPVDQITDRTAGAHNFTATTTARPTLTAVDATLSNLPTMSFDGTNDQALAAGWALSAPSRSNRRLVAVLMKQNGFTAGRNVVADSTSAFCVVQMGTTAAGRMQQNNGTARNDNTGLGGTGTWGMVESYFTGSTIDCNVSKGRFITTDTSAGTNGPGTARKLGTNAGGTSFANMQLREVLHIINPTLKQICQFRALVVAQYGAGVIS